MRLLLGDGEDACMTVSAVVILSRVTSSTTTISHHVRHHHWDRSNLTTFFLGHESCKAMLAEYHSLASHLLLDSLFDSCLHEHGPCLRSYMPTYGGGTGHKIRSLTRVFGSGVSHRAPLLRCPTYEHAKHAALGAL